MFSIILTFDDGNELDLRVADILQKYGLSAIFFIPSNCTLSEMDIVNLSERGFNIGGHTTTHPADMKLLSYFEVLKEIKDNKDWLEKITERELIYFCYPKGKYNRETVKAVKEAGFEYARTTFIDDDNGNDPDWRFKLRVDCHVYPKIRQGQNKWFDEGLEKARLRKQQDKPFMMMAHSWEIDKFNLWDEFEDFIRELIKIRDGK